MRRAFCLVVLVALACLLPRAARVGMAGDYVDTIGKITAHDEALYGQSAIAMARGSGWLTLNKPPLLIWLSALSARVFGIARLSLRLPLVFMAAFAIGIIFLWGAEAGGVIAGACAALLLLGNHLFHTLSTLVMTDVLLLAFTSAALYAIYSDPWLESRMSLWGYAAATAGAILTKGIAGLFPIAILALHWVAVRPQERPALSRAALAVGLAIAVAAPWFLYEWAVHPRLGADALAQTSRENSLIFSLVRLIATDPVLFSGVIVAIPAFVKSLRGRTSGPTLVACWLALTAVSTVGWQYRNGSQIVALVPALALIAACYGPFAEPRHSSWMLAFLCVSLIVKSALPDAPWGLNYRAGTTNPVVNALSAYCEGPTASGLVVVDGADDLYAALLPIQLRYVTPAPPPQELDALVGSSPDFDFLIPDRYRPAITPGSHKYVAAESGFGFLMAARGKAATRRAWTCRM